MKAWLPYKVASAYLGKTVIELNAAIISGACKYRYRGDDLSAVEIAVEIEKGTPAKYLRGLELVEGVKNGYDERSPKMGCRRDRGCARRIRGDQQGLYPRERGSFRSRKEANADGDGYVARSSGDILVNSFWLERCRPKHKSLTRILRETLNKLVWR
ncbi:MAG: hypothetical protein LBQ52_04570 [Helicobacteraceae bacterium]|jgi:hypothetical protein|nr:hypothetical protein [Helicobacteraceae bacterium]